MCHQRQLPVAVFAPPHDPPNSLGCGSFGAWYRFAFPDFWRSLLLLLFQFHWPLAKSEAVVPSSTRRQVQSFRSHITCGLQRDCGGYVLNAHMSEVSQQA